MNHEDDFVLYEIEGVTWARYGDGTWEQMDGHDDTHVLFEEDGATWALFSDGDYAPWSFPVSA
ncbi:hypothetical protein ITJ38_10105 [Agreia pratensis]|uniref:hypothetical protein n=1 Tax=Agreia pratensis TaxID=150121 RepID=UPI00188CE3E9|nr:hypothetical protein [Agreia pratensis]MBF4634753.1 hypothetical protein [Agreia pratensis]